MPLTEPEVARVLLAFANSLVTREAAPINPVNALGPVWDALAAAVNRSPPWASGRAAALDSPADNWRDEVLGAVLKEDNPHLDWARVVASLDFPEANFLTTSAFRFFVAVVLGCNGGLFPVREVTRKPWNNARFHVDVLRHAIGCPPELISFA
jgi:hypothetical protein